MSDDLRTRLVRVFHDAETNSCATQNDWNLLADAVIRELQLTEDGGVIVGCIHD